MAVNGGGYQPGKYRTPDGVPADIVIFTIVSKDKPSGKKSLPVRELQVLLVKRRVWPFEGKWALPGGFTKETETVYECAERELAEETGVRNVLMEYFNVYSKPGRDPRGWMVSHAFYALVNESLLLGRQAGADADELKLMPVREALEADLAFDHGEILRDALERVRRRMLTTTIAREFLPETFTLAELYQVIRCVVPEFEEPNFIRKLTSTRCRRGILEEVRDEQGRPLASNKYSQRAAQLYRFADQEPELSIYN
nr:NUDIX domain-containing protein [Paenibacillus thermoaerophilus]